MPQAKPKQAQIRMVQREVRMDPTYHALMSFLPDACFVTDAQGHILEANDKARQLFKTPSASLAGQLLHDYIAKSDLLLFLSGFETLLADGVLRGLSLSVVTSGGSRIPFWLFAQQEQTTQQQELRYRWLFQDRQYTKRLQHQCERQQESLTKHLAYTQTLLCRAPLPMALASKHPDKAPNSVSELLDTLDIQFEGPVETLFGFSRSTLFKTPGFWLNRIHPEDQAHVFQSLEECMRRQTARQCHFRFTHGSGQERKFRALFQISSPSSTAPSELLGFFQDETQHTREVQENTTRAAFYDRLFASSSSEDHNTLLQMLQELAGEAKYMLALGRPNDPIKQWKSSWSDPELLHFWNKLGQRFRIHDSASPKTIREDGLLRYGAARTTPLYIPNLQGSPYLEEQSIAKAGWRTLWLLPLQMQNNNRTVFAFFSKNNDAFPPHLQSWLLSLCAPLALQLHQHPFSLETGVPMAFTDSPHFQEFTRLSQLFADFPDGVCLLDNRRRVVMTNEIAREIYASLEVTLDQEPIHSIGQLSLQRIFARADHPVPLEVSTTQSPPRTFEICAQPLKGYNTEGYWLLLLREVSQLRILQERTHKQERLAAVGQLAGGVAHDFNNILTSIIGFSELLLEESALSPGSWPPSANADLSVIAREGKRGAKLVQQLMDFSRKSNKKHHALQPLPLLKDWLSRYHRTLPEHVQVSTHFEETRQHSIRSEPKQFCIILENLVQNALDAMPQGGILELSLHVFTGDDSSQAITPGAGHWLELRVSDTGEGMTPDAIEHALDPFYTTRAPTHTGLGLAQVYGILQQHHAQIVFESEQGQGTTVRVFFPRLPEETLTQPTEAQLSPTQGQEQHILFVDDNAAVRHTMKKMLQYLKYQVLCAEHGEEALTLFAQHKDQVALVVSDYIMPKLDGFQLMRRLREQKPALKFVFLSSQPLEQHEDLSQANGWLSKPTSLVDLGQLLHDVLML